MSRARGPGRRQPAAIGTLRDGIRFPRISVGARIPVLRQQKPGETAERRVARHYRLRGYRILGRNVRAAGNELDLIVRRGRRLVFCEVKEKTGEGFGDPLEMVDAEKRRRIRRAATAWLAAHPESADLQIAFEVVSVRPGRVARIRDDLTS